MRNRSNHYVNNAKHSITQFGIKYSMKSARAPNRVRHFVSRGRRPSSTSSSASSYASRSGNFFLDSGRSGLAENGRRLFTSRPPKRSATWTETPNCISDDATMHPQQKNPPQFNFHIPNVHSYHTFSNQYITTKNLVSVKNQHCTRKSYVRS